MSTIFKTPLPEFSEDKAKLRLLNVYDFADLSSRLSKIKLRGTYDNTGKNIEPYHDISFTLETIYPAETAASLPQVTIGYSKTPLYTSQPTLYDVQSEVIKTLYNFLNTHGIDLFNLEGIVEYEWEGRGIYHVMPPIIERHVYSLNRGYLDIDAISERFDGYYVKDARQNLHHLGDQVLSDFYIDHLSRLPSLHVFNPNVEILNYGLSHTGDWKVNIICDGSHRIDYALEYLQRPIRAIVVEGNQKPLLPYYALPVPFRPSIRLSSKRSEVIYPNLARDKVHLLNSYISKVLHYDWEGAGLHISSLRLNKEMF